MTDDEVDAQIEAAKDRYMRGEIDADGLDAVVGRLLGTEDVEDDFDDHEPELVPWPPRGPLPKHLESHVTPTRRRRSRKPQWWDEYAAWRASQADLAE